MVSTKHEVTFIVVEAERQCKMSVHSSNFQDYTTHLISRVIGPFYQDIHTLLFYTQPD